MRTFIASAVIALTLATPSFGAPPRSDWLERLVPGGGQPVFLARGPTRDGITIEVCLDRQASGSVDVGANLSQSGSSRIAVTLQRSSDCVVLEFENIEAQNNGSTAQTVYFRAVN